LDDGTRDPFVGSNVAQAAQAVTTLGWIPMGRAGSADEVASAAVFLASLLASYVSGQTVIVDGGATAAGPFPTS
jgi:NAD(P)-dependent dehydrogenase (short-subunit alcohol dehydrogenase family)